MTTTSNFNSNHAQTVHESPLLWQAVDIFEQARERSEPWLEEILQHIAPEGELRGDNYLLLNPHRADGGLGSFSFSLSKQVWKDFAEDDVAGSDITSLVAYVQDISQGDAAKEVLRLVDAFEAGEITDADRLTTKAVRSRKVTQSTSTQIAPVPAEAPDARPWLGEEWGNAVCKYRYTDAEGRLLGYMARFEKQEPGEERKKTFRPWTYRQLETGEHRWKAAGFNEPFPLYNLYELANRADAPVLIVEGEKAADAAKSLCPEFVVVTTLHGAEAPEKTDFEPLKGRKVWIWPDNDGPGAGFAKNVKDLLRKSDALRQVRVLPTFDVKPGRNEDGSPCLEPGFLPEKGWDAADAVAEGWTAEHLRLFFEREENRLVVSLNGKGELVDGVSGNSERAQEISNSNNVRVGSFCVSDRGVYKVKYKDGNEYEILVSSRIDVVAQTYSVSASEWGFLLVITDPDGKKVEYCLPRALMNNKALMHSELLKRGADVYSSASDDVYQYLLDAKPEARAMTVNQPGWCEDRAGNRSFVLPGHVCSAPDGDRIVYETRELEKESARFGQKGDLKSWQAEVASLCVGNSRLGFSVCVALTGPVLRMLGEEGGGFHLYGQTSIGKSSSLKVAASVWGNRDFAKQWKTTANAMESLAYQHNETTLLLDEIHQAHEGELGDIIYTLGNGSGKARADRDAAARAVRQFRVIYLSNGEESVPLRLESTDEAEMGGQEVRLPSIPADAGKGMGLFEVLHGVSSAADFAQHLDRVTYAQYGSAGRQWVRVLVDACHEEIRAALQQRIADFLQAVVPNGSAGQVQRVARRFAVVAAVGEQAIQAGILNWPVGEAADAAAACFKAWVDQRGGVHNQESHRYLRQVKRFLELHGESRFTAFHELADEVAPVDDRVRTVNRVGWRKVNDEGRVEYFLPSDTYKSELCFGLDHRAVTKLLRDLDLLVPGTDGKSMRQERIPGHGSKKVYRIKPEIHDIDLE